MAKKKSLKGGGKQRARNKLKGAIEKKNAKAVAPKEGSISNPFESVWSRRKFDVLGKKRKKGEARLVGRSRSLAVQKRKETLLQEYKQKDKGNKFLDRRFGEKDDGLDEEEKAILRFKKERQAQISRQSKFALQDEDDEEEVLTHGGMVLSTIDDYNDKEDGFLNDEDDDFLDGLSKEEVLKLHFGGGPAPRANDSGDVEGHKPKTKKEIMEELIAKSKYYKAQKVKEKQDDQNLQDKLNKDFSELVQSQALSSLFRPTRKDKLKAMLTKKTESKSNTQNDEEEKVDDFEKMIKEMTFDVRARATDRLKTDDEVLKEERERLEELEEKRQKRMLGEDSDVSDNENDDNSTIESSRKKMKNISGDDLGENFVLDDEKKPGSGWVDEVLSRKDNDESDSEDEDEEDEEDDEDDTPEELDVEGGDDEETREELLEKVRVAIENKKKEGDAQNIPVEDTNLKLQAQAELPFVIDAPKTLAEFCELVDGRSNDDLVACIHRIRTCNAISLAAENIRKMQIFFNVLLQYFGSLAVERPFPYSRIDSLTKPLIEMSMETPVFAATCARERLVDMHSQITKRLKSSDGSGGFWPSLRTLLLLRLWCMTFPPSDLRHPVMTPAILFMSEVLCRCPVTCGRDVAVGSFLCSLLFSALKEARRFCPEALNFISILLISCLPAQTPGKLEFARSVCPAFMVEIDLGEQWLALESRESESLEAGPLDFVAVMTAEENGSLYKSDVFKINVFRTLLLNLIGFISIYRDLVSFPEIFTPTLQILKRLKEESVVVESMKALHAQAVELLETKIEEHERLRQPVRMRVQKKMPFKQFNPKFEENFMPGRNYDPDRERAERKKMVKKIKSETKGAVRELRKDNYFIMEEKGRERQAAEEERKEKYGKAMAFLQEQEAAYKSGQLGKGRGRRRR